MTTKELARRPFTKVIPFGNAHCDFLFCTIPILHRFVGLVLLHALNALWDIGSFKADSTDYKPKHRFVQTYFGFILFTSSGEKFEILQVSNFRHA